eukprot:5217852-Pleurochrysis_carterae.AAC.2
MNTWLLAWYVAVSLLASEPAVVEPIKMPTLETSPKHGRDGVHRAADHVDSPMVGEAVQHGRVSKVLEHAVVINMARYEVAARSSA